MWPLLFLSLLAADAPSPAPPASGQSHLRKGPDGALYLSWVESAGEKRHALRFAVRNGSGWSSPKTIAEGGNWFVNWADFPTVLALPNGRMAAHWLVRQPSAHAYDAWMAQSSDGGASWGKPFPIHRDGTPSEHGFVSMFPESGGRAGAVWLDGREQPRMTLRYAAFGADGVARDETILDDDVCTCCPTSAAMTPEGPIVAYRDHEPGEIRDISVLRRVNGKWSAPRPTSRDGWKINGCPVNGPALAVAGRQVALAWFTMAEESSRVKVAFSSDAGETFQKPIVLDGGNPAGRTGVVLLEDGSAVVSWLEKTGGGELRVRRVGPEGKLGTPVVVATASPARSTGMPQIVRAGEKLLLSWTGSGVQLAEIPIPGKP